MCSMFYVFEGVPDESGKRTMLVIKYGNQITKNSAFLRDQTVADFKSSMN